MKSCKVYGLDSQKLLTPIEVRDAILVCFKQAHEEVLALNFEDLPLEQKKEMEDVDVHILIASIFHKVGGDYDSPTKEILLLVVEELADYGKQFRSPDIVEKHLYEIKELIEKIPDEQA